MISKHNLKNLEQKVFGNLDCEVDNFSNVDILANYRTLSAEEIEARFRAIVGLWLLLRIKNSQLFQMS